MSPEITAFFDSATFSYSYVVSDPGSKRCAIIDPVLDYDAAAGRISYAGAERLVAHVREQGLTLDWLLETHVHADHLSAAAYLKRELGGRRAILLERPRRGRVSRRGAERVSQRAARARVQPGVVDPEPDRVERDVHLAHEADPVVLRHEWDGDGVREPWGRRGGHRGRVDPQARRRLSLGLGDRARVGAHQAAGQGVEGEPTGGDPARVPDALEQEIDPTGDDRELGVPAHVSPQSGRRAGLRSGAARGARSSRPLLRRCLRPPRSSPGPW